MSAQYKVCYSPQFYENLTQNDQVCIDEVYKQSVAILIKENNIINEHIIIPSNSQLDYLESQLDAAINVSNIRNKNEAKMSRLRSFIEKHTQ